MRISYSTKTRLEKTEIYLFDYLDYRVNYSVLVILFWQIWLISSYISLSYFFSFSSSIISRVTFLLDSRCESFKKTELYSVIYLFIPR